MRLSKYHILPVLALACLLLCSTMSMAQSRRVRGSDDVLSAALDSIVRDADTTLAPPPPRDTSRFIKRHVDLDHVVYFTAKDSIVMFGRQNATMYGSTNIKYGDIDMTAAQIAMNLDSSQVHAIGRLDSVGELVDKPLFKDNSGEYESRQMSYNFKSKKGYITDIVTEQGEGFLTGGITKKMENDEYYIKDGRYTTCDNHEDPHFYFQLTKAKVRPKHNVVTGPAYMVLEDLPLPIAVPFGYFPFTDKYSSGILFPTFGEDYNRGFYLRNGGYYLALNEYFDLALTGEIYTRGSWGLAAQSNYNKRYKFSGNFSVNYITTVTGDKGDPDYSKMHNFQVIWSHSQNAKANPNMTFSASVNFATSGYTRNNLDTYYTNAFTENTKSSTINFTYKFPGTRWSLSSTASISQRTADSTLSVQFPNFTLTMSQFAPFKRKRVVGSERWYEKITISYSGRFQNSLTAKQDEFLHKSLVKDWRNGMTHSMPIRATFNVLKYFNITPGITLNDRMYTSKIRRAWDPNASAEVQDTTYNFYNVFDFNFALSLNTKIYGFFKPMKFLGDKLQMVRHVLTPTVTFSAAPNFGDKFWGYYGNYDYVDSNGQPQHRHYSYFQHGLFGSVQSGRNGLLSVTLANNLEAKVRSDQDSTGYKKISLIENFTLSQSYNFAVDSMRWSNLSTSMLLRLTKGFNLNLNATWDVYKYELNEYGNPVRVNKLRLTHGGGWGRLSSTGTSFNYTINNGTFTKLLELFGGKKKDKSSTGTTAQAKQRQGTDDDDDSSPGGDESDIKLTPEGYAEWSCPWSITANYSVNYGYGTFNKRKMEYNNFTASYDFENHKIAYMNCSVSRQMHCFVMTASFVPVGPYKSYNFHIAVKSSILQDVKYDKHSSYSNGIQWY